MPAQPRPAHLPDQSGFAPDLARLLDLAGPKGAPALMAQIVADLSDLRHRLGQGAPADQRDACHALIAVAGTIGAQDLCGAARAVQDGALAPQQLLPALDRLIAALVAGQHGT